MQRYAHNVALEPPLLPFRLGRRGGGNSGGRAGAAVSDEALSPKRAGAESGKRAPAPKQDARGPEVIIVGAGAAGIAAARRLAAAGRRYTIVEAAGAVGGRCITDTTTFGVPYDRGAHWIHTPEINPLAKISRETGLDIYPAPPGQRLRIGRRYAREGEMEDYLAALVRATAAINDAARRADVPCAQALPKDSGRLAPDHRVLPRPVRLRQGPFGDFRRRFLALARTRC